MWKRLISGETKQTESKQFSINEIDRNRLHTDQDKHRFYQYIKISGEIRKRKETDNVNI